ncbi:MAG: UMP kinase [Candidatus Bathyarchaeia archaeon]|nr:MAG: UMP kinase [Candidatus Bathyarchaeota archaeon]
MRIVLKIGGSVIASPINPKLICEYVEILKKLKGEGHNIVVVVGGGSLAREFIKAARELGLEEKDQDDVAISISRIIAQLFTRKFGEISCETVPFTVDEAVKCFKNDKIVVMGGLKPGMTTDTVAAMVAGEINAEMLVKATDQEGVYDKDPRKYADAVKLESLRYEDLSRVFAENKHRAGIHQILDPEAVKILKRKRIKVVVVNGFKPENILAAINNERVGTVIH